MLDRLVSKETLHLAVLEAHDQSARRANISHDAVILSAIGSGDYSKGIIAALATIGGIHAPLAQTFDLLILDDPEPLVVEILAMGMRVPGWGNGFWKGQPDPLWKDVNSLLEELSPVLFEKIVAVTAILQSTGKIIFPNPSCYTAAAGILLGFNRQTVGSLFVGGRLDAWTELFKENMQTL